MSGVHGHKKVFQLWIKVENNYAKCCWLKHALFDVCSSVFCFELIFSATHKCNTMPQGHYSASHHF